MKPVAAPALARRNWLLTPLMAAAAACGQPAFSPVFTAGPVVAPDDTVAAAPVLVVLAPLPANAVVRLRSAEGVVAGVLRDIVRDTVRVDVPPERGVAVADIDSAWVRSGSGGTGALAGAVLGGVAGAAGAAALCESFSSLGLGGSSSCGAAQVVPGALIGALAGAGLGSLIGSSASRWQRIYP